jgi:hypothetical protein
MRCPDAIYQSLTSKGWALKRELVWCPRTRGALRAPRERSRRKIWAHVPSETLITELPAGEDVRWWLPGLPEAVRTGRAAPEIATRIHEELHADLLDPMRRLTAPDAPVLAAPQLVAAFHPNAAQIVATCWRPSHRHDRCRSARTQRSSGVGSLELSGDSDGLGLVGQRTSTTSA